MSEHLSLIDEVHRLLDQRPFRPFTITMDSGERFVVTGRHQMAIGRTVAVSLGQNSPSVHMRIDAMSSVEEEHVS